jgi:hypothetical protein
MEFTLASEEHELTLRILEQPAYRSERRFQ